MKRLIALLLPLLILGCIPKTGAEIEIGVGYNLADLEKLESMVEGHGFERVMRKTPNQKDEARFEETNETFSIFRTSKQKGFGIGIHLKKRDGLLMLVFAESNTSFSPDASKLFAPILADIKMVYGETVRVTNPPPPSYPPT